MNVIKFKDIAVNSKDWYNATLRGKYAYWIHCRFAVSFDDLTDSRYVELEKMNNDDIADVFIIDEINYLDIEDRDVWVSGYIDLTSTNTTNSIEKYELANSFVPDDNITLDELKKFRTWLATNLLTLKEWDENDQHVLTYYKEGMTDDVVKWLSRLGSIQIGISNVSTNTCGCVGNSNLSSLYNDALIHCDSLSIYRNNIKLLMVTLFSNVDTWKDLPVEFLDEIIKYLNGIIKANLPLVYSNSLLDIYSCKCLSDTNIAQTQAQLILTDLIKVFEWIKSDSITGHKNNISTTLTNWSTNLYELMEWS